MECWDEILREMLEVAFRSSDSPKAHINPRELHQALAEWKEDLRYTRGSKPAALNDVLAGIRKREEQRRTW